MNELKAELFKLAEDLKELSIVSYSIDPNILEEFLSLSEESKTRIIHSDGRRAGRIKKIADKHGCEVKWYKKNQVHGKFFLTENKALVSTGNLTKRGLEDELNLGISTSLREVRKSAKTYFDGLWRGVLPGGDNGSDLKEIRFLWSPEHIPQEILSLAEKSDEMYVVSPFIGNGAISEIRKRCENIQVLVNLSYGLREEIFDIKSLAEQNRVYSNTSFHAKIYLFDGESAIVSSANATDSALLNRGKHEVGIYIEEENLLRDVIDFVDFLQEGATMLEKEDLMRRGSESRTPKEDEEAGKEVSEKDKKIIPESL